MNVAEFLSPMEMGFAGFAAVLLFILFWMIRRLLETQDRLGDVIKSNTVAMERLMGHRDALGEVHERLERNVNDVRDRLLGRPCLKDKHL